MTELEKRYKNEAERKVMEFLITKHVGDIIYFQEIIKYYRKINEAFSEKFIKQHFPIMMRRISKTNRNIRFIKPAFANYWVVEK